MRTSTKTTGRICDYCTKAVKYDDNIVSYGGLRFDGWYHVTKEVSDFTSNTMYDTSPREPLDFCSLECMINHYTNNDHGDNTG